MTRLEDKHGLPWTASTGIGWIVLLTAVTCGFGYDVLSIYLALWIYTKGRSVLPLLCFSLVTFVELTCIPLMHAQWLSNIANAVDMVAVVLWFAATFHLRHEIIAHYRESEGLEFHLNPWYTALFTTIYINYRLNPVTFLPEVRNPITSLNLSTNSAKIAE